MKNIAERLAPPLQKATLGTINKKYMGALSRGNLQQVLNIPSQVQPLSGIGQGGCTNPTMSAIGLASLAAQEYQQNNGYGGGYQDPMQGYPPNNGYGGGYQDPMQGYPPNNGYGGGYQDPMQGYPQNGYQNPGQGYPQNGYQNPGQGYPQNGYQNPAQGYQQNGYQGSSVTQGAYQRPSPGYPQNGPSPVPGPAQASRPVPPSPPSPPPAPVRHVPDIQLPSFTSPVQRGQKVTLPQEIAGRAKLDVRFGWNVKDARCDIDASAFLVNGQGRVPDESWFVFYGQPSSADGSVTFSNDGTSSMREVIGVDMGRLSPSIEKLVFVLTINECFEQNLNFSMIKDAYIQITDHGSGKELVSYCLREYFDNVTSMTMGELYLYKGQWKFNPVGNGVHKDLAGQCALYGVEIE